MDNLKLGYGGTKSEMERLIAKANELRKAQGLNSDLTIESYADVITAIHEVQTAIGITGTTQHEAGTTIQGSLAMVKASYKNLLVGVADENADLDTLVSEFIESVKTAAHNIAPVVRRSLDGLREVGELLAPMIGEGLVVAVEKAPEFLQAGLEILGTIARVLMDNSPAIMDAGFELLGVLLDGFDNPREIFDGAAKLLTTFAEKLQENGPTLADKAFDLLVGDGGLMDGFIDNAPNMVLAAIEIMAQLAIGLLTHLPDLLDKIPEMVESIENAFTTPENIERMKAAGEELGQALLEALPSIQDAWNYIMSHSGLPQLPKPGTHQEFYTDEDGRIQSHWVDDNPGPSRSPVRRPPKKHQGIAMHANGLPYVPYDNYPALLHRGEQVLTRREAEDTRRQDRRQVVFSGLTINITGAQYSNEQELAQAVAEQLEAMADRRSAIYAN